MRIDRGRARGHLERGEFQHLFVEELGWDRARETHRIPIGDDLIVANAVADKRSFKVFVVQSPASAGMLAIADRRLVRDRLAPHARENLVIFVSADHQSQIWQWTRREIGRPLALREYTFIAGQTGESLLQRLDHLIVDLDEEEEITILDVADRARLAFDAERPSRRFYDRFKTEHDAFLARIGGIASDDDRSWYASVMLNRLMFVYFIQQKGFLDGDRNYLRNRLQRIQAAEGPDQFHRFYRQFLLRLFFDGLGGQEADRSTEVANLLGRVPYLNGGMFVEHFLEQTHDIEISDAAFVAILDFFDEFDWHLDDRPVRTDNEINPDVLGYIFERYINNKQMGAYYTKEDVTEYIGRSTVIPRLLDMVAKQVPNAFSGEDAVWTHLRNDPGRYIFPSLKVGAEHDLPANITQTSAAADGEVPENLGLPRETWRGFIDRKGRHEQLHTALAGGEVSSPDAMVSMNLDIRQFAQDVIDRADDPSLIDAFYRSLSEISVLDPTCGSGAFLFAVLNLLEPIYEATLDRMAVFLDEATRTGWVWNGALRTRFETIVAEAASHRNRKYFVFRSIVVNNLFGVDIMEEAVEICKLRLFLKLASQLEEQADIEPLPDIDFNVRAGNALIGYTDHPRASGRGLDLAATQDELERQVAGLSGGHARYRQIQFGDRSEAGALKRQLIADQEQLDATLNRSLGERYSARTESALSQWAGSHQPFHWWAAYYEQMERGGFDVIVGNPPYISSTKVRREYTVLDLETERAGDIYAWVMERSASLLAEGGRSGMIVPLSLSFSSRFTSLREVLTRSYAVNWYSSFGRIPAALFAHDVRVRNTIHVGRKATSGERTRQNLTGRLHRWFEQERPFLFETLAFTQFQPSAWAGLVPKVHTPALVAMFEGERGRQIPRTPTVEELTRRTGTHVLHFKKSAYNWLNFCRELPPCYDRDGTLIPHTKFGTVPFATREDRDLAFLMLNGKWEFAYWYMIGDDFDVTIGMFEGLPLPLPRLSPDQRQELLSIAEELETAMRNAVSFKLNAGKRVGNFNLARCRHITDRSDIIFGEAFGWMDAWADVELLYAQAVKTSYADAEDDAGEDGD
ncbi:BREX-1 system adenine-specific DNA-methyltransferase PglX [Sphingomonas donggukensis]|uniref:site-specific DNA-methyltransferase (adenine-specific) n=1 Tax=Sphingomonas donggukensis TaxID=2949093 RepID=A0ABY4TRM5_9SPHN|nr:Eco57I restriction-modification methylase domain-containing protein [Sphingomonas donggukensis]URW75045.1 BREX-1 system adenine-specific DNA-methyltransferase PglX [Sphingomonas donggukensis]